MSSAYLPILDKPTFYSISNNFANWISSISSEEKGLIITVITVTKKN